MKKFLIISLLVSPLLLADPIPYDGFGVPSQPVICNDGENNYGIIDTPCYLAAGFDITGTLLFEPGPFYGLETVNALMVEGRVALNLNTGEFFDLTNGILYGPTPPAGYWPIAFVELGDGYGVEVPYGPQGVAQTDVQAEILRNKIWFQFYGDLPPVPEPGTVSLVLGALLFFGIRRKAGAA